MDPELKQWLMIITPGLIPTLAVLIGMLQNSTGLNAVNRRIDDVNRRFDDINRRIDGLESRITELRAEMNRRFDESREVWRAELRRVEEVIDARLKHLEER